MHVPTNHLIIFSLAASMVPFHVEFDITNASLMQFKLTNNNTLYYNFKVNITAKNSRKIIYYRRLITKIMILLG